eukprot:12406453-Karenia_brevis.AAC.1
MSTYANATCWCALKALHRGAEELFNNGETPWKGKQKTKWKSRNRHVLEDLTDCLAKLRLGVGL